MKVIVPIPILDSALFSTTVPEPDTGEVAWNPATSYIKPTVVYRPTTHKTYQSTSVTGTVNAVVPEVDIYATVPKWIEVGSTNRYSMFDLYRNTQTTVLGTNITLELRPTVRFDSVALLDMENISNINIVVKDSSGATVLTVDKPNSYLDSDNNTAYYSSYVNFDIPPFYNMRIVITLTGVSAMKIGVCAIGKQEFLGSVQRGANTDFINFSVVNRDLYGSASFVQRRSVPTIKTTLFLESNLVNRVSQTRDLLNATPAIWCGLENTPTDAYYDSLLIMGFYRNFSFDLNNPIAVNISLELEEI